MALNTQMPNVVLAAQEAAAAREAERQEREHREKKREPKRRRTVRKSKHEEPAQPVRQAEEEVQPAPVQEVAPAGQAVKTEIRSTGNEPFVSTQSAQPVKPLGNATEADLSLFSSSGSKRPARRGQYRINHEERRK